MHIQFEFTFRTYSMLSHENLSSDNWWETYTFQNIYIKPIHVSVDKRPYIHIEAMRTEHIRFGNVLSQTADNWGFYNFCGIGIGKF